MPTALFRFDCGIVDDGGLRLGQEVHLPAIHMHAMRGDAPRAEDAELVQPLHHAQAVLLLGVFLVALRLGDVDVKAGAQFVAQGGSLLQRGVLERERRMEAEEGGGGWLRVEGRGLRVGREL